ncbi:MAG: DNA polymerase III subunit alpha [Acidobacteriota bacterium]
MTDFVHLHLHSEYSLLDGGNRVGPLVAKVKELGMDAVALTDHGNLFGAVHFYQECKKNDIKPILGIEAYVAPDVVTETSDRRHKEQSGVADGGFHLVLLAQNETGWRNLLKLTSDSYVEGFYYRPRMDKTTLQEWNEGLIAINGHLGSSIAYQMLKFEETGNEEYYEKARTEAAWHAEIFGPDAEGKPRFYLELQRHETEEQDAVNQHVLRLAEDLGLPLVCDNDAHFLRAKDWDAHDTLVCVSTGKSKTDERRMHYPKELYVKGPEAMAELFDDVPQAIATTREIADRCNVELDFSANHAPLVGIQKRDPDPELGDGTEPEGSTPWFQRFCSTYELVPIDSTQDNLPDAKDLEEECDRALRELCEAGLQWRYRGDITDEHLARLERELKVLSDKMISAYFLIVWDFVNEARRRGIPAMARGSGVGTMVGYLLGLSNACPVKYGLLFERFTDPDRSEYPDIDIDLCQDGRAEIIEWVRDKYGYVAQIITFGTMKAKAAVRDVGRVLDLPLPQVDKICKLIGDQLGITLSQALEQEPELRSLCRDPQVEQVIETAKSLEGITRHSGVHAAGVVLATQPLENLVPLATSKQQDKEILVTQWDGPTVEKMGLLKMDFLGLKTLSVLERARQLTLETLSEETIRTAVDAAEGTDPLDLDRIDFKDEKVLATHCRGETVGTFQFESDGMRNLLLKMKPDRLEDLVAANALFRPGPMALIDDYCNRKHGRQQVPKVHEIVDRFTAETHGIMVYQEQVMLIAHELGGIPLREAYSMIKAISKKKHDVINSAREKFLEGAEEKGLARTKAAELFDLILKFAGYGFNKSHSVGYSILAFQTAFLKTYFPVQYMAAVLTYEADSTDKMGMYLDECKRVTLPNGERGIDVRPPDINLSGVRFHVVFAEGEEALPSNGHIRFGLSAVRGVGGKAVDQILEQRDADGPFKSLFDFCERVPMRLVNRSTIEALIKSGAFDSIHGAESRAALMDALDAAIRSGQQAASDRESGQASLFGGTPEEPEDEPELPRTAPWSRSEMLRAEKEALGFFASGHPLDDQRVLLERLSNASLADLRKVDEEAELIVGAMITGVRTTRTKKGRNPGQKMGMLTLEDNTGKLEAVVFADAYAEIEGMLQTDNILFFRGRADRRREEPSLVVSGAIPLSEAPTKLTQQIRIVLDESDDQSSLSEENLEQLREILRQEKRKINGSGADVIFEIHLADRIVRTAPEDGLRVPVHAKLPERIGAVLGERGRCYFAGPSRIV